MQFLKPMIAVLLCLLFTLPESGARDLPESWPDWLKKEMQKEQKRLRDKPVEIGDGLFETRVPGKLQGEPEAFDGGWMISTDIGSDIVMECWLLTEKQDLAALAARVANINIDNVADANGGETARTIWLVEAGNVKNHPWLALEWLYNVGENENKRVGLVKVRAAQVDSLSLACSHNALGYQDTFARAFTTLLGEASAALEAMPAHYREIYRVSIGEQPVGYIRVSYATDEEGDTRNLVEETMLMPVDSSNLSTSDSYATVWSRADGSMINAYESSAENGELTTQLQLTQTDEGDWWVSGTVQGKEIDSAVSGDGEPLTTVQQMHVVRDLLADESSSEAMLTMWVPDADPTTLIGAKVVLDRERGDGHGTMSIGPLQMNAHFDEFGSTHSASVSMGAITMNLDRIWQDGTPP
jgi:hypothetical protein